MPVDSAELHTTEVRAHLFVAVDRISKVTCVERRTEAAMRAGARLLLGGIAAFPYAIHTVRPDDGIAFAEAARYRPELTATTRGRTGVPGA